MRSLYEPGCLLRVILLVDGACRRLNIQELSAYLSHQNARVPDADIRDRFCDCGIVSFCGIIPEGPSLPT